MSSAGQILGGIAGGVIGFFAQNPFLGAQIGLTLGGLIDPPKGPTVAGPRLDDLTVQTSTYGAPIPRIYGTATVVGNVIWLENNRLKETVTKKKSGGKGGGSKTTTKTYSYSATFAVALCKGPIVGIRRLWIRSDLVYDAGSSDPATIAASNQSAAGWTLYTGTDTQAAAARLQATLGVANTPAWRGLAYLVFQDLALAKYANSLAGAQVRAEVVTSGSLISAGASDSSVTITASIYDCAPKWDGSRWFFIGRGVNVVLFSADGVSFTTGATLPNAAWKDIAFNGSMYLAVAAGNPQWMANSTDMVNWSWWSYPTSRLWTWIVTGFSNNFLVVEAGTHASLTPDNVAFTLSTMPITCECKPAWNGSVFCVLGSVSGTFKCTTSSDGVTWSAPVTLPSGITQLSGAGGLCARGSTFLAVGWDNALTLGKVSLSNDNGATWSAWVALPSINPSAKWCAPVYGAGQYCVISTSTKDWATSPDGVNWTLYAGVSGGDLFRGGAGFNGAVFARVNDSLVSGQSAFTILQLSAASVITSTPAPLSSIVSSECLQSGLLSAGDIDVSALTSSVRGYRIGTIGTLRSALEPLQASWPFDVVQRGYKLTFKPRGGASVATIAAGDLDARGASQEPGVQITQTREVDNQLARRLTVRYLDSAREYDAGSQYAERLSTTTIRETVVDLPIVLDAGEAAGKAEVLLYAAWLARMQISFNLPATYLHLEPADVVTLPTPEGSITVRLTTVNYTSDNRVECRATLERAAVYTPAALGVAPGTTGPTTLTPLGPSTYALLDLPRLGSSQDGVGFPVAMCGADSAWPGGALMRSADAGATWDQPIDFAPPGATIGVATTTIGVVESRLIDAASRLTVTLTSGTLSDVSELAMLAGANHFAYGAAGRWEIIAARSCTLQSGSTYILSNLLRGRFGSEWAMGLHATSDVVVLLDSADLQVLPLTNADIGAARLFRAITSGRDFSTDSDRAMTYAAVNLKPLSPVLLNGSRDPGTGDWSLTWTRRTRKGGEWLDGVDAELGEAAEAYDIEVYADGSYATLKRTITASSPSCAYSSADQVSDFGSNQSTLYLKVYQRSATVGRGYPLTTAITR